MYDNNIWNKAINFLKAGVGASILVFAINCFGYFYISGYLSYFNINILFHEFNLFNDFFILIMSTLLFVLPSIEVIIIIILGYNFFKIPNLIKWIKSNKWNTFLFICIIIFLLIAFPFCNYCVYREYYISVWSTIIIFAMLLIFGVFISIIVHFISLFIKKYLQKDIIDILFISFIILTSFLIISPKIESFGRQVATTKDNFIIIDKKYVVLYNTSNYALVSEFEKNDDNGNVKIFANEFIKLNLTDHNISYAKFDSGLEIIK